MKTTSNGHEVEYRISGPEKAPVLVFSHSLASSLIMWEPQAAAFEKDFRVLRYDIRGHGGSEATPGEYSLELLASDILGLLDALKLERVHFVGLSLGGMIGQALGLNFPNRLLSLTLCDTSPVTGPEARETWRRRIEQVRREGLAPQLDPTMSRWFTPAFLGRGNPLLIKIKNQFLNTPIEGYAGCAGAIMKLDYLGRLPEIRVPTKVIVGEEDPGTTTATARSIRERIAGSSLTVIPAARHLPNAEQPEVFNEALLNFLKNL